MKKTKLIAAALALVFALTACGPKGGTSSTDASASGTSSTDVSSADVSSTDTSATGSASSAEPAEQIELIVFAAASMTETLKEIQTLYAEVAPNVTLSINFDSSGTLKTQIQEGAECDVFISAGQKQMNQMDINASAEINTEGLDLIDSDSRIDLLENQVTLVVAEGNPKGIESFDDLAARLADSDVFMAVGNSDVPVGQYTQKILDYFMLEEGSLAQNGLVTYGSNVKEVTTQVAEGSVDCGVVYCTDAFSSGLTVVDYATAEMCGRVIYPAAVVKESKNAQAAADFLNYLTGDEAMAIFENVGFSRP